MHSISARPADLVTTLFGGKALIGVVHCPPFPGSPRHDGRPVQAIYDACLRDVDAYLEGGMNGLIVENHGDVPFLEPEDIGPETSAFLSVVTDRIVRSAPTASGSSPTATSSTAATRSSPTGASSS